MLEGAYREECGSDRASRHSRGSSRGRGRRRHRRRNDGDESPFEGMNVCRKGRRFGGLL